MRATWKMFPRLACSWLSSISERVHHRRTEAPFGTAVRQALGGVQLPLQIFVGRNGIKRGDFAAIVRGIGRRGTQVVAESEVADTRAPHRAEAGVEDVVGVDELRLAETRVAHAAEQR